MKNNTTASCFINNKTFELPISLRHIIYSISDSKILLDYKYNWDDEGAEATNEETLIKAIDFVILYSETLYDMGVIIESPSIDILPCGGISVEWITKKGKFLISFKKDNLKSYFYGTKNNNKYDFEIKGYVENNNIENMLIFWFKENLIK